MRYIELFAGIGGFRSALDKLGYECVFASEIDKYASAAYKTLYGGHELQGDITKIDVEDIPEHDLLVGGFPCQAFSIAGQRKGFEDTRGTLFFEIIRIASSKYPKWLMLENVKGLLSHDGGRTFEVMCACLNDIGYAIDFKVLNSKYYGVPQNRERIFIMANRDAEHDEWKIDGSDLVAKAKKRIAKLGIKTFNFDFPNNKTVDKRLRDVLQSDVPEKFYLSKEKTAKLIHQLNDKTKNDIAAINTKNEDGGQYYFQDRIFHEKGIMPALTSFTQNVMQEPNVNQVGYIQGDMQGYRVYDQEGLSTTVAAQTGGLDGNGAGLYMEPQVNVVGHADINGHDILKRVYDAEGLSPTINTGEGGNREPKIVVNNYRIRKLTPLECFRLQGFTDDQFARLKQAGISDSQLYKMAGNAVTVNVIQEIAERFGGVTNGKSQKRE